MLKLLTVTATVTGCALAIAFAEDTATPPARHGQHGGAGAMFEQILPPKVVETLALTADQKTALDGWNVSFKADAAKWRTENPVDEAAAKQARETGDKEALRKLGEKRQGLMDIRKGYVDKFRASLTDEQKAKLDKGIEEMRSKQPHAPRGAKTGPATATPPPAE